MIKFYVKNKLESKKFKYHNRVKVLAIKLSFIMIIRLYKISLIKKKNKIILNNNK